MSLKLEELHVTYLGTEDIQTLSHRSIPLIEPHRDEDANLAAIHDKIIQKTAIVDEILARSRKSEYTLSIADVDALRDNLNRFFRYLVRAFQSRERRMRGRRGWVMVSRGDF